MLANSSRSWFDLFSISQIFKEIKEFIGEKKKKKKSAVNLEVFLYMSSASVVQVIPVNFKDGESLWGCLAPLAELTIPPVSLVAFSFTEIQIISHIRMVIVTTSLHSCSNVYLPVFLHASTSKFSIAQVDTVQQGLEIIPDLSRGNLLND